MSDLRGATETTSRRRSISDRALEMVQKSVADVLHSAEDTMGHAINSLGNDFIHKTEQLVQEAAAIVKNNHNSALRRRGQAYNIKRAQDKIAKQKMDALVKQHKANFSFDFNFSIGSGNKRKLIRYEEVSLGFLNRMNPFRQFFVRLLNNPWFETFILTMIILNAVFFAVADYSKVDSRGELLPSGRNLILLDTNTLFTVVFTTEMIVKIIAQGFFGRFGYLRDPWNFLDFVVVVTTLLIIIDNTMPSVSSLRLIRILRPLRSLTMLPGLRDIVKSIFASIPELGGVFSLMGFIFLVYAITGMELFGGPSSHARCRSTPYPVLSTYVPFSGLNFSDYRCLDAPNYNLKEDNPKIAISPWAKPQDCYWPLAASEQAMFRVCSLSNSGFNNCLHDDDTIPISNWAWCGSNFDADGYRRFLNINPTLNATVYGNGKYPMNDIDMFVPDLDWGYINFDNFGSACLTIFQSITTEGWAQILYITMDAYGQGLATTYFVSLILLGVFFVLQLLLAVLEDNFNSAKEAVKLVNAEQLRLIEEAVQREREERSRKEHEVKVLASISQAFKPSAPLDHLNLTTDIATREHIASLKITRLFRKHAYITKIRKAKGFGESKFPEKHRNSLTISIARPASSMNSTKRDSYNDKVNGMRDAAEISDENSNENDVGSLSSRDTFASSMKRNIIRLMRLTRIVSPGLQPQIGMDPEADELSEPSSRVGDSLAEYVALRSVEAKTMSTLTHLTIDEFIGESAALWIEDKRGELADFCADCIETFWSFACACKPTTAFASNSAFYSKVSATCARIAHWKHFETLSGVIILLNCMTLMADRYPMSHGSANFLDDLNAALTLIFLTELVINILAFGPRFYGRDAMSFFDAFVVLASMLDLTLSPPESFSYSGVNLGAVASVSGIISILRCFRLFRIVKLAIRVKSLKVLFSRVARTVLDLATYMILLMVLVFIYSVAGLQFFSNMFRFDENGEAISVINSYEWQHAPDIPRYNFDDFTSSFASVFQIVTTENWNDIMYNSWRSMGPGAVFFSCSLILFGTFILMNLFLGILLSNFTKAHESDNMEIDENGANQRDNLSDGSCNIEPNLDGLPRQALLHLNKQNSRVFAQEPLLVNLIAQASSAQNNRTKNTSDQSAKPNNLSLEPTGPLGTIFSPKNKIAPAPDIEEGGRTSNTKQEEESDSNSIFSRTAKVAPEPVPFSPKGVLTPVTTKDLSTLQDDQYISASSTADSVFPLFPVNTLGIFGIDNRFRIFCGRILEHHTFETLIQLLILLSSLSLAIDNPLNNPVSAFRSGMRYFEWITTILFTGESLIKIVVTGFAFNRSAYLRSGWNQLDFAIVVISLITLFDDGVDLKALKSIRSLRALRPLRVISRAPGLRTLVTAVFDSIPDVINVLAVVLVVFSIFAIISVNFLKGDLRQCSGANFRNQISKHESAIHLLQHPVSWSTMDISQQSYFGPSSPVYAYEGSQCDGWPSVSCCPHIFANDRVPYGKDICECWGGDWTPSAYFTVDNYPQALMTFFSISTSEGWVDLMYAAVDSNGINMQPIRNNNYGYVYFFVLFIICGNFFALNLFVGVMIDNFEKTKLAMKGEMAFMSPEQQEWAEAQQQARSIKPHLHPVEPEDKFGKACFKICQSHIFEVITIILIFLNTAVLAADFFGISESLVNAFNSLNVFFACSFTFEMFIKLFGLRKVYFQSAWNVFDFIVTIGSDIGIIYFSVTGNSGAMAVMLIRVFRVLRVVRLMEGMETARRLVDTLIYTLPGIFNITLLLLLVLFIYAVLGMQLFAKTEFNLSYSIYANFRTFRSSLLTLVRFATGEAWGVFMFDAAANLPGCVVDPEYNSKMCGFHDSSSCIPLNGCGSSTIFPFLISFTLFVSMVLFNLFVGVIIEGFSSANDITRALKNEDYIKFCEHWSKFDPHASCFISIESFEEFVGTLSSMSPMGLKEQHPTHHETVVFLTKLDLHVYRINGQSNFVHFKEVLVALISEAFKTIKGTDNKALHDKYARFEDDVLYGLTLKSGYEKIPMFKNADLDKSVFTLKEHYAALKVQHVYEKFYKNKFLFRAIRKAIDKARAQKSSTATNEGEPKRPGDARSDTISPANENLGTVDPNLNKPEIKGAV